MFGALRISGVRRPFEAARACPGLRGGRRARRCAAANREGEQAASKRASSARVCAPISRAARRVRTKCCDCGLTALGARLERAQEALAKSVVHPDQLRAREVADKLVTGQLHGVRLPFKYGLRPRAAVARLGATQVSGIPREAYAHPRRICESAGDVASYQPEPFCLPRRARCGQMQAPPTRRCRFSGPGA